MIQMIEKLADQVRSLIRDLREPAEPTAPDNCPDEQEGPLADGVQTAPPTDEAAIIPPTSIWQRIVTYERARFRWLLGHPYVVWIAGILIIVLVFGEQIIVLVFGKQKLKQVWQWLLAQARRDWSGLTSRPAALIGVAIILVYLTFGLQWLRCLDDFFRAVWAVIRKRSWLWTILGSLLVAFGLWLVNNRDTWVISPLKEGRIELEEGMPSGEQLAIQLIAEVNQVGACSPSPPVLQVPAIQSPLTLASGVTASGELSEEECNTILKNPVFSNPEPWTIPCRRGSPARGSTDSSLDMGNLSIGTFKIPSQLLVQFLQRNLPASYGYREFSGQVYENNGELTISISTRNPDTTRAVTGPSNAVAEMIEFLALRLALDNNPELTTGASGLRLSQPNRDLAFALGTLAFRQQRYRRALAFFELADRFVQKLGNYRDRNVDVMLGLSRYHVALMKQAGDDPARFNDALRVMEDAVEDTKGEGSLLRLYLACLYQATKAKDAQEQLAIVEKELDELRGNEPQAQVNELEQIELEQTPLRGPGRHLLVSDKDVIYVDDEGAIVVGAAGRPFGAGLEDQEDPRQIALYGDANLLFISSQGVVHSYNYDATSPELLIKDEAEAAEAAMQQLGTSTSTSRPEHTNLFLLTLPGSIYWCDLDAANGDTTACGDPDPILFWCNPDDATTGSAAACPDGFDGPFLNSPARQIFPIEDQLYTLTSDGSVWHTEIDAKGRAPSHRQLMSAGPVQEFFVASDGTLYLLHDNGNVWRYYNDRNPGTDDLTLIDPGTGTIQVFAADGYLYLLKSNGVLWRVSNPRNPDLETDFTKFEVSAESGTIQEIFVKPSQIEGDPDARIIYLLTNKGELLGKPDHDPPDGLYRPKGDFAQIWENNAGVRQAVGWASEEYPQVSEEDPQRRITTSLQKFENGVMIWREEDTIYVLHDGDRWWHAFDMKDEPPEPERDLDAGLPECDESEKLYEPTKGFGVVWKYGVVWKHRVGMELRCAKTKEESHQFSPIQDFERGTLIGIGDSVYVLTRADGEPHQWLCVGCPPEE